MSTIYRKYRPQKFADVTGQDHIIKTITSEIRSGKLAHAYLFSGPRGIGKTTLARLLAKSVNCQNRKESDTEPCNECPSCVEITAGHNIDVIEIDAASHTGVDNVRENIIENAQFKPTKSKFKIFIIDEVHMLSTSAFNALLKTLEEPPSHVIFILATTEPHELPATIISRCQRFNFKKVGFDKMMDRLKDICEKENVKIDKDVLERVINKSDGCMRDAESLLGQLLSIGVKKISAEEAEMVLPTSNAETILEFLEAIIKQEAGKAINLLSKMVEDGVNLEQFIYDTIETARIMMIFQTDSTAKFETDYSEKDFKQIRKLSAEISAPRLIAMIESLLARKKEIKFSPIPQLPLELFVINFTCADNNTVGSGRPETISSQPVSKDAPGPAVNDSVPDNKPAHNLSQTIKETISNITRHKQAVNCTLADIAAKWSDIISKIGAENHSLNFILAMSTLKSLSEDGTLKISVPYSFHKDKLEENKTKKMIEKCLEEILSEKIFIYCEVTGNDAVSSADAELSNLAADFGGEVME
jgi:DNA polymerase-3 subunit gamma/tau